MNDAIDYAEAKREVFMSGRVVWCIATREPFWWCRYARLSHYARLA